MKKILVLNDFVSWGRIAGGQVDAILTYKNYDVLFLPTALISNIFSEGEVASFDTSSYLEETFNKWLKMDSVFDAVFIGYIKNSKQKDLIVNFLKKLNNKALIVHDPIMADNGALYKGLDPEIISVHREISEFAHIILPNYTEAKFISSCKEDDLEKMISILGDDNKKVVITSVKEDGDHKIISYEKSHIEKIPYDYIHKSFAGTGDIFDGIFLANYLKTYDLNSSIAKARDSISKILKKKLKYDGASIDIKIEKYLDLI